MLVLVLVLASLWNRRKNMRIYLHLFWLTLLIVAANPEIREVILAHRG
ncbi:hypothetical protein OIU79_019429, partial [Salix purpurea]